MTKARDLADYTGLQADLAGLQTNITAGDTAARAGRKNILINGGFDVWQRGAYTSATGVANDAYYVDRFFTLVSLVTATLQNTANSAKVAATSSATGYIGLSQKVEDKVYNTLKDKTLTLSAKVTSNNSNARLRSFNGSAWADSATSHSGNGTEETLTHTFTVSSSPSNLIIQLITYDGGSVALASGDYIEVTGVQLEVGSVATDFEHRSYGEELQLCQRFCQIVGGEANHSLCTFATWAGSDNYGVLNFSTIMRAAPSSTFSSQTGYTLLARSVTSASTSIVVQTPTTRSCEILIRRSGGYTQGDAGWVRGNINTYITFDAEI